MPNIAANWIPQKLARFLAIAVFLLASSLAHAERLPVKIYTSADGLGSSFINYLARDSRGFIWLCTRDGLSRFDGSRFVTYRVADKDSPPGIENIYEARDGTYWITTTGGTFLFDPNKALQPETTSRSLNATRVAPHRGNFLEDSRGNFWLGSDALYLIERNSMEVKFTPEDLGLPPRPDITFMISSIVEGSDGSLWMSSSWGPIRRMPDGRVVYYRDNEKSESTSGGHRMLFDKSGRIWTVRHNRLYVMKPEAPVMVDKNSQVIEKPLIPTEVINIDPDSPVRIPKIGGEIYQLKNPQFLDGWYAKQMIQSGDGSIWITAEMYLIQISETAIKLYSQKEGLPNVMGWIAEDGVGNLWIASRSGVARLDRNGLVSFGSEDGAASSRFFSVIEGIDGAMYFGNPTASISRYQNGKFTGAVPKISGDVSHIWTSRTVFQDSGGDFWILTGSGLHRFSGIKDISQIDGKVPTKSYGTADGLRSDGMFQIFEDSSGSIWVSTRGADGSGHGLSRMKRGETKFTSFDQSSGLPPEQSVSSFTEDKNGNIWIGIYEGGVLRFDGERFQVFGEQDGIPTDGVITDLHIDKRGRLWLSSAAAGLFLIEDTSSQTPIFKNFSTANGLSSNNVRTITEDRFGRIYLGNARGMDRFSPDTGRVKHYSTVDGLASDFVVDSKCDTTGACWFVSDSGVSRLIPEPDERSVPPKVWLGGIRIAGIAEPMLELGSSYVELPELTGSQNNIQIDYFGIDLRAGESLRFQYKLDGTDADWSVPSESNTVTFANLKPASYVFLVRAVNAEGQVSEESARLAFTIVPPFWQRWWFLLLIALIVAGITAFVFHYRTARLREINAALRDAKKAEERLRRSREERIAELEKVRARIATDLHDDIGASLTQIAILSEVAQAQTSGHNGKLAEPLTRISEVSNELVGTMSDIVWSINPSKDHLSDLTQRMRRFAADVFSNKEIKFQFLAPVDSGDTVVSSNIRREVFLIFKETVNNVLKHSNASSARIEIAVEGSELVYRISDDGVGFDPEDPAPSSGGHGIGGMKHRVEELGGKLQFISEKGQGTTVSLTIPLLDVAVGH